MNPNGHPDNLVPNNRSKTLTPLMEARDMQRLIYRRTKVPGVDNRELAQLALAWERLEERRRVMRNRPAPKPVDVTRKSRPGLGGRVEPDVPSD